MQTAGKHVVAAAHMVNQLIQPITFARNNQHTNIGGSVGVNTNVGDNYLKCLTESDTRLEQENITKLWKALEHANQIEEEEEEEEEKNPESQMMERVLDMRHCGDGIIGTHDVDLEPPIVEDSDAGSYYRIDDFPFLLTISRSDIYVEGLPTVKEEELNRLKHLIDEPCSLGDRCHFPIVFNSKEHIGRRCYPSSIVQLILGLSKMTCNFNDASQRVKTLTRLLTEPAQTKPCLVCLLRSLDTAALTRSLGETIFVKARSDTEEEMVKFDFEFQEEKNEADWHVPTEANYMSSSVSGVRAADGNGSQRWRWATQGLGLLKDYELRELGDLIFAVRHKC